MFAIKHLRAYSNRKRLCDSIALSAGLGESRVVWSFQMSGEQQRHTLKAMLPLRGMPQKYVCGVAPLANGTTIGSALRLASIIFVAYRIIRFLLE
jgi:hypothetical protein